MNFMKMGAALASAMALVACNSTTDSASGNTGGSGAPSTIFDLNLPDDFDRDALPQSARDAFDEFNRRNQLSVATAGPGPSGNFLFLGEDTLGLAVAEDDGSYSLVQGDIVMNVNVDTATVGGQFQDLVVTDADGNVTPLLGQVIRINAGALIDGRFSNTLSTDSAFNVEGEPSSVTGTSQGAFVGDGSEALGIVNATVTVGANAPQAAVGGYTADRQ